MKIAAVFATASLANDSFGTVRDNAIATCALYMKNTFCPDHKHRVGKYSFRLEKVRKTSIIWMFKCFKLFNDAVHHLSIGNCGKGGRNNVQAAESVDGLSELQAMCLTKINLVFSHRVISNCGRLGAWRKRARGIFNDMRRLDDACLKKE